MKATDTFFDMEEEIKMKYKRDFVYTLHGYSNQQTEQ